MDAEIVQLAESGLTYSEISVELRARHGAQSKCSSLASVKRTLKRHGFKKNSLISDDHLEALCHDAMNDLGPKAGRTFVKGHILAHGHSRVSTSRVGETLKRIDPENHTRRDFTARRRLNPIPYRGRYFGHKLHIDQNEKMVMYGVTLVAAIDGYSGLIVSTAVMPVKNNSIIYDQIFRKAVHSWGMWDQLVVDCGTEFVLTLAAQSSLSNYRTNTAVAPYIQTTSARNNRIERFWQEVNDRVTGPVKNAIIQMEENGVIALADPVHRFCCSAAAILVIRPGLELHVQARNHRFARGRGRPSQMTDVDLTFSLPPGLLPSPETAANEYRANGGALTDPYLIGFDPLHGDAVLMAERRRLLGQFPFKPCEIFRFLAFNQVAVFQNYIVQFVTITNNLAP